MKNFCINTLLFAPVMAGFAALIAFYTRATFAPTFTILMLCITAFFGWYAYETR